MNRHIKHCLSSVLTVFLLNILTYGCSDWATSPSKTETGEIPVSEVNNIVWTLAKAQEKGSDVDISRLPAFHLIFDENQFFGDDGCNWFGAQYEMKNDSIYPEALSETWRLCIRASFSVQHLTEPFQVSISGSGLQIKRAQSVYTYKSEVRDSIENSGLVGGWQLHDSTDPEFADIQTQGLIPTLSFDENRTFEIVWYCVDESSFGCDQIGGIFGVGKNGAVLFYQREGAYHGEGAGEGFMQRILGSNSFEIDPGVQKAAVLKLVNEANNATYEFSAIRR